LIFSPDYIYKQNSAGEQYMDDNNNDSTEFYKAIDSLKELILTKFALKIKPVQLFDENSSLDTILLGDRNKIVDDLSETLYVKLKADIHRDIENALKKR
jgi:hypothetical protein